MPPDQFFEIANYAEAGLWFVIACGFAVAWLHGRRHIQQLHLCGEIVFTAFGVSDMVEAHTGAWWRPWWLLIWKGVCVIAITIIVYRLWIASRSEIHQGE